MRTHPLLERLAQLSDELDGLRAENARLREVAAPTSLIELEGIHLPKAQRTLLTLLLERNTLTRDAAHFALYQDADDAPDLRIIDVFLVKLRRSLAPLKVKISTRWGIGWFLTPEAKRAITTLAAQQAEEHRGRL